MWHLQHYIWGMHWMWWLLWLFFLVFYIILLIESIHWRDDDSMEALKNRFTKGEISREEYDRKSGILQHRN